MSKILTQADINKLLSCKPTHYNTVTDGCNNIIGIDAAWFIRETPMQDGSVRYWYLDPSKKAYYLLNDQLPEWGSLVRALAGSTDSPNNKAKI